MTLRTLRTIVIVSVCYVAAQIFADIMSLKAVYVGLITDGGTIIYPITFTLRDMIHKMAGAAIARTVIISAAVLNLAMAGLFQLVNILPAAPGETAPPTLLFGDVLAPVIGIVIASIVAEVIAELLDTEIYQQWVKRMGQRMQWGRVLASNAVSVPVDSLLFVGIATAFGIFSIEIAPSIFLTNIIAKGIVTIISIPAFTW